MDCKHCILGDYYNGFCYCDINNKICLYVRKCNNEKTWKPLTGMKYCKLRKKEIVLDKNEYKVRFEKDGDLFIEIGKRVIRRKNPYNYIPDKVKMKKINNDYEFLDFIKENNKKDAPKKEKKSNKKRK